MKRRQLMQSMGGLMAAAAFRPAALAGPSAQETRAAGSDITGRLARYMAAARDREIPPAVVLAAKHRILDTLGAIVSGARLKPGEMAISYVRRLGGIPEASVPATDIRTAAVNAALAAGMFAHADEIGRASCRERV